ncbi:MAG: site-specific integrase, partial [SAR324 cluster bacterium]|nr:site-specific integrase [SAR324 cluster bacterium]
MATIVKRKNGTFQARIRVKGAKPISETFSSKSKAERWALSAEAAVKDGRRIPGLEAKKHLLSTVIDRYIQNVLPEKKDQKAPQLQLRWWKAELGHLYLSDLTPAVISEAKDKLLAGPVDWSKSKRQKAGARSPSTVARYLA